MWSSILRGVWYVQEDQQDRASHRFHGHPEKRKDRVVSGWQTLKSLQTAQSCKAQDKPQYTENIWGCYSLQLQRLRGVLSHRADHVGPMARHTNKKLKTDLDQFIIKYAAWTHSRAISEKTGSHVRVTSLNIQNEAD